MVRREFNLGLVLHLMRGYFKKIKYVNWVSTLFLGQTSYFGLNDIQTEGLFVNTDSTPVDFTAWNPKEPNNVNEEDCVLMLAVSCSANFYFQCYAIL